MAHSRKAEARHRVLRGSGFFFERRDDTHGETVDLPLSTRDRESEREIERERASERERERARDRETDQRFRGGLVFKAHRLVYHSTLGLTVIKKKKKKTNLPLSTFSMVMPPSSASRRIVSTWCLF